MSFSGNALMANFQKPQLSLILRVAWQILQILQISGVICRILQIPRGSTNCPPKFLSKKLARVCSQKILQFFPVIWFFFWNSRSTWLKTSNFWGVVMLRSLAGRELEEERIWDLERKFLMAIFFLSW